MPSEHPAGATFRTLVVRLIGVFAIVAVLVYLAIWIPGLPGLFRGAYLARGSLHNIYGDLRLFDEANGHLPPATTADEQTGEQVSWRIEVYQSSVRHGFMRPPEGNSSVSIDYDRHKAWNDPANLRLQELGAWLFRYTQVDTDPRRVRGKHGFYTTYYKAVTGMDTAFDCVTPHSLGELPDDLILVLRVERSDTHWMQPGDLRIEQLAPSEETRRLLLGKDGYVVLFADGEGWVLSGKTPLSDLCKFLTLTGAKEFNREQLLGPYLVLP